MASKSNEAGGGPADASSMKNPLLQSGQVVASDKAGELGDLKEIGSNDHVLRAIYTIERTYLRKLARRRGKASHWQHHHKKKLPPHLVDLDLHNCGLTELREVEYIQAHPKRGCLAKAYRSCWMELTAIEPYDEYGGWPVGLRVMDPAANHRPLLQIFQDLGVEARYCIVRPKPKGDYFHCCCYGCCDRCIHFNWKSVPGCCCAEDFNVGCCSVPEDVGIILLNAPGALLRSVHAEMEFKRWEKGNTRGIFDKSKIKWSLLSKADQMACMHHLYMFDVRERLLKDYDINIADLIDEEGFTVWHDNVMNLKYLHDGHIMEHGLLLSPKEVNHLRKGYGDEIGWYYAFQRCFTKWVVVPLCYGGLLFDYFIKPYLTFEQVYDAQLWFAIFVQLIILHWWYKWEKDANTYRFRWHLEDQTMIDFERIGFTGDLVFNPHLGVTERVFPGKQRALRFIFTVTMTWLAVFGIFFFAVTCTYYEFKFTFQTNGCNELPGAAWYWILAPDIVFAVFADTLITELFFGMSHDLTDFENHKYQSDWDLFFLLRNSWVYAMGTMAYYGLIGFVLVPAGPLFVDWMGGYNSSSLEPDPSWIRRNCDPLYVGWCEWEEYQNNETEGFGYPFVKTYVEHIDGNLTADWFQPVPHRLLRDHSRNATSVMGGSEWYNCYTRYRVATFVGAIASYCVVTQFLNIGVHTFLPLIFSEALCCFHKKRKILKGGSLVKHDQHCDGQGVPEGCREVMVDGVLMDLDLAEFPELPEGTEESLKAAQHDRLKSMALQPRHVFLFRCVEETAKGRFETYEDWMEVETQLAMIAFFAPTYPFMGFLFLMNNLIETHMDLWKMMVLNSRVVPQRMPNIGPWTAVSRWTIVIGMVWQFVTVFISMDARVGIMKGLHDWIAVNTKEATQLLMVMVMERCGMFVNAMMRLSSNPISKEVREGTMKKARSARHERERKVREEQAAVNAFER